jgi:ubiquinone/menaquinone biosynthesis C-methylase UbiE
MNNENNPSELIDKFEGFARYYDQFMLKLVNYPAWVDYIIKIFKEHNIYPRTILDLACGTGIPSLLLAKKGVRIIGVDNSLPMLEVFKEKVSKTSFDVQLVHSDIRNFSLPEKTDAAISLYDSINYLLSEDDLKSCFKCVFDSINPNGIFTFDMNTVYCLESFWSNRETPRQVDDIYSIWQNSYNPEQKISTLTLTVFTDDGRYFKEIHKERGYPLEELQKILQSVGFTDIKFFVHLTFLQPIETTYRIMIIARKPI